MMRMRICRNYSVQIKANQSISSTNWRGKKEKLVSLRYLLQYQIL